MRNIIKKIIPNGNHYGSYQQVTVCMYILNIVWSSSTLLLDTFSSKTLYLHSKRDTHNVANTSQSTLWARHPQECSIYIQQFLPDWNQHYVPLCSQLNKYYSWITLFFFFFNNSFNVSVSLVRSLVNLQGLFVHRGYFISYRGNSLCVLFCFLIFIGV